MKRDLTEHELKVLTATQRDLLIFLRERTGLFSPTEIGEHFGKPYNNASSWACRHLKKLVSLGFVENFHGTYKAIEDPLESCEERSTT